MRTLVVLLLALAAVRPCHSSRPTQGRHVQAARSIAAGTVADTSVARPAVASEPFVPTPSVLFGRMGETCQGAGQRCVMVANSWGLLQPAFLDGKAMSAQEAAVALLQDQNAVMSEINGSKVTPTNIQSLMGLQAVARADGRRIAPAELERRMGSGAALELTWEPVPGFDEAHVHTVHATALAESRQLREQQEILPTLDKVTDWMSGKAKRTVANVVDFVADSTILKSYTASVQATTSHLASLFQCLGDLPPEYHLGGITTLLNQFVQEPERAFRELFRIWVKKPLATTAVFVRKQIGSSIQKSVEVEIGDSSQEEKCVAMPLAGALHCEADSVLPEPARAEGEEAATFDVSVKDDHTTVCVKRTDMSGGWKSNIRVACAETMQTYPVLMGRSTGSNRKCLDVAATNLKCHKDAAHIARLDYASVRNESAASAMTFEVDVDVVKSQVCVARVDAGGSAAPGWDVDLRFVCKVSSFQYTFQDIVEGTWKDWNFERMWILFQELMSMENMEVGYCFTQHVLWPLKEPAQMVVRGALGIAESIARTLLSSAMAVLEYSLEGLQLEEIDFAGIKVADVAGAVSEKVQAMCMTELEAQIEGTSKNTNMAGVIIDATARIVQEASKSAINWMIQKVKNFAVYVVFVPLLRQVANMAAGVADAAMLVVEGICGIIPHVGGFICDIVTVVLSQAIAWLLEPVLTSAILLADAIFDPIQKFFAEFIVNNLIDGSAWVLKKSVKGLAELVRFLTRKALSKLPWVGDGPGMIISAETAHKLLDRAVASMLRFVQRLFTAAFPTVRTAVDSCTRLHQKLAERLPKAL